MSPKLRWVFAIVGLLAVNLIAMVVLIVMSARDASQVIPGYDRPARPSPTSNAKHAAVEAR
jgi:hypothetical protein